MKKQKVILVAGKNVPPEKELEERLKQLGDDWTILSASTALAPHGFMNPYETLGGSAENTQCCACHIYYVTTIVLEKMEE